MSVFTVHPGSEAEEKALKTFLDTLKVKYEKDMDETEYLLASKNNRENLDESIRQIDAGQGIKISLDDIWK